MKAHPQKLASLAAAALAALAITARPLLAAPQTLSLAADTAAKTPARLRALAGETFVIRARVTQDGGRLDTAGMSASFFWQTNNMPASAWWSSSNPATVSDDGVAEVLFTAPAAQSVRFFFRLGAVNEDLNYIAFGDLQILASPGPTPNALPLPVPVIDFAAVATTNAPWALADEVADMIADALDGAGGGITTESDPIATPMIADATNLLWRRFAPGSIRGASSGEYETIRIAAGAAELSIGRQYGTSAPGGIFETRDGVDYYRLISERGGAVLRKDEPIDITSGNIRLGGGVSARQLNLGANYTPGATNTAVYFWESGLVRDGQANGATLGWPQWTAGADRIATIADIGRLAPTADMSIYLRKYGSQQILDDWRIATANNSAKFLSIDPAKIEMSSNITFPDGSMLYGQRNYSEIAPHYTAIRKNSSFNITTKATYGHDRIAVSSISGLGGTHTNSADLFLPMQGGTLALFSDIDDAIARLPAGGAPSGPAADPWLALDIATNLAHSVVVSNGHWFIYTTERN